ncbi:uncharacterized protein LOC105703489 [Orussus abietinus]|uniref:uncharacterized protein LOC105703489 n=1 Tax=Orussus abietinus TaxID=222816 RepID=UPI0006259224|nr:uncharacterized protein LOC105703489 [Orussus abietinus]
MVSPLGSQKESVKSGILETPHEEEHQKHHKTSKPETVKSKKGSLLKSIESTKEEVNVSLDTGFWGDFNKMSAYVKAVQLFYKPWHFAYSSKISDTFDSQGESKAKSTTGKDSKKKDAKASTPEHLFRDRYRCSSKLRKSKNEPLYLLVDSVQLKFFLVEFSTSKVRKCEDSDSVLLETSESSSYAVIEAHNFCSRPVGDEPVAELKTKGTKSIVFELEPGRHLFSIFVHSETAFFMKILSDTVFYIGNRQTMYEIMSMESCLVDDYVKRVSDGLNDALQAFGTPDYRTKLKRYYQSYIPADKESSNRLNRRRPSKKRKTRKIHSLFSEGLSWAVTSSFPEISGDILRALRIFFINPDIGINDHRSSTSLDNINYSYYELRSRRLGRSRSEEMTGEDYEPIDYDRAALLIQSFFRRVLIKRYMQQHDPNHPKHRSILEQLFKLAELFNYNKRESIANVLFRNLMKRDPSLCGFYPCAKEFQHVLQVQKCSGILNNVSPGRWIPIVRLSINVPANTTTQMFADLFISLPRYTIRVFNNDTAREIFRIANDVAPTNFRHSRLGYTVFCYGWSEANRYKELNWELNLVSVKGDVMFYQLENMEKISPLSNISRLVCKEFFNNYIPNIWKLIGRWSLEVTSTTIASFRFRVSFDRVKIKLKILKDDKVLKELVGGHTIILPLVRLVKNEDQSVADARKEWKGKNQDNDEAYERSEKETKDYYLEAYVLDDSWPLLESDWVVVDAAKKRGPNAGIKMSKPSSMSLSRPLTAELAKSKHGTKKSLDINYLMESPYWVLQVISDAGSDIGVVQDTRREEEIAEMKSVWVADKPDRLQQGCRLREEFLNKNRIVLEPSEVVSKKKISTIVSQHKDVNSSNTARLLSQLSDDNQRTLVPPENMKNLLPKLDLTIYMVKEDEEEDRWYKTEYDEEMLRSHRAVNMFDFEQYYLGFLEESNDILNSQRQKYSRLLNNYSESVSRRKSLLNTAYETRTVFIDSAEPFPSEVEDKQKRKKKK